MGNLPGARMSPRICNGELHFFAGDTFSVELDLDLVDQDGAPVKLSAEDSVDILILDRSMQTVQTKTYTGIAENKIMVDFDEALVARMPSGRYSYKMSVTHDGNRTTIASGNNIFVR